MDSELLKAILPPFFGAFFAFVFLRVAFMLDKRYDRKVRHYNALIRLEDNLNRYLGLLWQNNFEIKSVIDACRKAQEAKVIPVIINQARPIPFEREPLRDLANLELMNTVFAYYEELRRVNTDMSSLNSAYERAEKLLYANKISDQTFIASLSPFGDKLSELNKFISDVGEDTKEIVARSRVLIKTDKIRWYHYLFIWRVRSFYPKDFLVKKDAELQSVEEEIKSEETKSTYRISRIQEGADKGD